MDKARIIRLSADGPDGSVLLLSGEVSLAEGQSESWETITRVVKFDDSYYGEVEITKGMLLQMVRNFQANVYGQDIAVDIAHNPSNGAGGFIRELAVENGKLRGRIEWTDFGVESVTKKGYRYFSAEYHENYKDPESSKKHGALLQGAALTTRPRVKFLDPIDPKRLQLSLDGEEDGRPISVSPRIIQKLSDEVTTMWKELIKQLQAQLAKFKLAEPVVATLSGQFEGALKGITDEAQAKILLSAFSGMGEQLSTQLADNGTDGAAIKLDFSGLQQALSGMPGAGGLSKDEVLKLMADQQAEEARKLAESEELRTANVKRFTDAINTQDGFTDGLKKQLCEGVEDLITAEMSEPQIKALADNQIRLGNQMSAASKLAGLGWEPPGVGGSVHIQGGDSNAIKQLQEHADQRLGITKLPDSRRYAATDGTLQEENKALAEQVLAEFDRQNARRLHDESVRLAAGDGNVSDVVLPAAFERTVIREALYQLRGTLLVDVGTAPFGAVIEIPYSYRDTTGAGADAVRRYEGQGIQRAGVKQTTCEARPIPQKLSFLVSDELRYLMQAGRINWDAVSENRNNASRIIAEDTDMLLHNELLNAADEYAAATVSSENIAGGFDGAKTIFPLAQFPVVRPRKAFDLQGNQVGSTLNPITVTYDSVAREEYDGSGTQAAGIYYVMNYNHGEISFVDEVGAIIAPANGLACIVSYSYSTNVYKFDTDLGSLTQKAKWDDFLFRFGLRKNVIQDDRFYQCNFAAMSGNVMTQIEQAETFGANFAKPGTDLASNGDLGRIKDVAGFRTSAPGISLGDQRLVMGQRGTTRLRMVKPWSMGELENERNAQGLFTGEKQAYGDQFIVVKTPEPLQRAHTSMVLYSATTRVVR